MNSIEPETLSSVLSDEFADLQIEVDESSNSVIVTDSFTAEMSYQEDFEAFENNLKEFLMMYTEGWKIEKTTWNKFEGYYHAVIQK